MLQYSNPMTGGVGLYCDVLVLRQIPAANGPLDGEWLYYNFAAGSSHTKKLYSRLYSIRLKLNSKNSLSGPPFGGNLGVTYALHL